MKTFDIRRRRTLKILAAAGGSLVSAWSRVSNSAVREPYTWRGAALGASSSVTLYDTGDAEGRRLMRQIGNELRRLERLFSLYRTDSAISKLNAEGYLGNPPLDLVRVLSQAHAISNVTDGAFDVTVQPLWEAYAPWFRGGDAGTAPPDRDAIESALGRIGYRHIETSADGIRLTKPGMSVTFNGIAQGYITDRIADLLRAEGMRHVLIDLGEIRALNTHPSGRPWRVGLRNPVDARGVTEIVDVADQAVATSAGIGTSFDDSGLNHHIFDPRTGRSSHYFDSVSVVGVRATVADALSTGLYNLEPLTARAVLAGFSGYAAHVVYPDGSRQTWSG